MYPRETGASECGRQLETLSAPEAKNPALSIWGSIALGEVAGQGHHTVGEAAGYGLGCQALLKRISSSFVPLPHPSYSARNP